MELYKKHRPRRLDAMVGNEGAIQVLEAYLMENKLPHTLLFHGLSGCGKTTLARIVAKRLGCSKQDFKEINSADFRGIDSVREIIQTMMLAPWEGDVRVFLIDEIHKATNDAQNAFLKALEDTPKHVYFFLCTTEPQKLIKTIRTRSCEIGVVALTVKEMGELLQRTIKREKVEIDEETVQRIVDHSEGSARKALVLLDQVIGLPEDQREEAITNFKDEQRQTIELCRILLKASGWAEIASILKGLDVDPESVRRAVLGYMGAVLLKGKGSKLADASLVISLFEDSFFYSGKPALVNACYRAFQERQ